MEYKTSQQHFDHLVAALRSAEPMRPTNVRERLIRAAKERWIYVSAIEDLLMDMDHRLHYMEAGCTEDLLRMMGIPVVNTADRPRKRSTGSSLFQSISAVHLADLLIGLEALGFRIDPEPLVTELNSQLATATLLSQTELTIYLYPETRHKCAPIRVSVRDTPHRFSDSSEEWRTPGKYRVEIESRSGARFVSPSMHLDIDDGLNR